LRVLVVNAGSSSVKLRLVGDADEVVAAADIAVERGEAEADSVRDAVAGMSAPEAVGHRIVHGGERFRAAVRIDAEVEAALRELADLAPLHQPKSLAALEAVNRVLQGLPAVACFDTAFHATLPPAAATYALPASWRHGFGVRRYGFHGLSHAYAARRAAQMLGRRDLRLVSCHLGAGASLAAVRAGRSIDTTMGFTPLEGLVMATRSGSVDPGLLLWLLEREEVSEREMAEALEHDSGLAGLAGTADMCAVLERAARDDSEARLALDVYVHRLRAHIAAMAAALGGIDVLVFTGGVGENSDEIRALACDGLEFLGIALDPALNRGAKGNQPIAAADSPAAVLVIESREDLEIAAQVREVLMHPPLPPT
jgi:acetate kinase